jgi:hypothetical protein
MDDDDLDPMKTTKAERLHSLRVIGWSLTILKNSTADEAKRRRIERAERALDLVAPDLTSEAWPPEMKGR